MKKFYLAAMGLLVVFAVSAQNVETADLHQPVNVNDAVVTGGVLRTQVLRDSLMMNSETGRMEKAPVVVDYLDVPVDELGSKPEEAIEAAKVARRAAMRRAVPPTGWTMATTTAAWPIISTPLTTHPSTSMATGLYSRR